jgi:hypothetical protein
LEQAPVLTITEVVDEYLASAFINNQKYFKNYMIHAKWVWKDLFWNTLIATTHKYVEIDYTTSPASVKVPKGMARLFSVSLTDDCGQLVDLKENGRINTVARPISGFGCGCEKCNCTEISCGGSSEFSVRINDVIIDGVAYTEKVWNKKLANGDIVEIKRTPVKDYTSPDAIFYSDRREPARYLFIGNKALRLYCDQRRKSGKVKAV